MTFSLSNIRSIATVTRLGFGKPPGAGNVLCVGPSVNLPSTYSNTIDRTDRLATFMQTDSAAADLGYVTNRGWSSRLGAHKSEDDLFVLSTGVQFNRHLGFRMGFWNNFRDNFTTRDSNSKHDYGQVRDVSKIVY